MRVKVISNMLNYDTTELTNKINNAIRGLEAEGFTVINVKHTNNHTYVHYTVKQTEEE